jgi:hypothetical protein
MNSNYDLLPPLNIDFVDYVNKNPCDTRKVYFDVKNKNGKEVIQWCRRNFGNRGDGWDFSGGKHIVVSIWNSKLITMWEMWQN